MLKLRLALACLTMRAQVRETYSLCPALPSLQTCALKGEPFISALEPTAPAMESYLAPLGFQLHRQGASLTWGWSRAAGPVGAQAGGGGLYRLLSLQTRIPRSNGPAYVPPLLQAVVGKGDGRQAAAAPAVG